MKYYISKQLNSSFETAIEKVKESLKTEGFGVLCEINIQEKLKEKLGVDFRKYTILGACNPAFAHKALLSEDRIGTMLPCNVIVQEREPGNVEISAVDPLASMMAVENTALAAIASEVKEKLERVMNVLGTEQLA
jgi:uncharacterized protein (DUF302 family)